MKTNSLSKTVRILRYVSDLHLELRNTIIHPKLIPIWNFKAVQMTNII